MRADLRRRIEALEKKQKEKERAEVPTMADLYSGALNFDLDKLYNLEDTKKCKRKTD